MQRYDNFGWTIMNKRHTYTDGQTNHPCAFTDGLIIVVKKPFLQIARELFAMICVPYSNCLGRGIQILATGTGDIHGYEGYKAIMVRNNDLHNSIDCITNDRYYPDHQNLAVSFGKHPSKKVYMHLREIDGVYDVVETNESQKVGKYFIIVDRNKQQAAELNIHEIMQALSYRIRDIADNDADNAFPTVPVITFKT